MQKRDTFAPLPRDGSRVIPRTSLVEQLPARKDLISQDERLVKLSRESRVKRTHELPTVIIAVPWLQLDSPNTLRTEKASSCRCSCVHVQAAVRSMTSAVTVDSLPEPGPRPALADDAANRSKRKSGIRSSLPCTMYIFMHICG